MTKDSSREDISLSLSEDTTEQSKASSGGGKGGKQQNGKRQGPTNVDFMGRNAGQKQQNEEIMEGLNGSYYGRE